MADNRSSITPVVLSGGSGTRLWPVSRALHPKQLLPIADDRSMLQATVTRFLGPAFAAPVIVGGEEHRFLIADQVADIGALPSAIILEPAGRNTAAAIALAAHHALAAHADAILLVVPSDHVIADPDAFQRAVATGAPAAAAGWLVTFGIAPAGPETGYGYIEAGAPLDGIAGVERVAGFVEKPDAATAASVRRRAGDICGTAASFYSAPIAIWASSRPTRRRSPARARRRWRRRHATVISSAPTATAFLAAPEHLDRLCRYGADRPRRAGPGRHGLVRRRVVGGAVGNRAARRGGQRAPRRRRRDRFDQLPCSRRQRSRRGSRRGRRPRRRLHARFGARHASRAVAGGSRWSSKNSRRATARGTRRSRSSTARGVPIRRPTPASASRPSGSSSNRAASCRCKCTTIGRSTGSWCPERRS